MLIVDTGHRARDYLTARGECLEDWDGCCGDLADALAGPNDSIIYVSPAGLWRYHVVPLIDGLVHDAWCAGPPLPVRNWLNQMFGADDVEVLIDGRIIYTGPAGDFVWPDERSAAVERSVRRDHSAS